MNRTLRSEEEERRRNGALGELDAFASKTAGMTRVEVECCRCSSHWEVDLRLSGSMRITVLRQKICDKQGPSVLGMSNYVTLATTHVAHQPKRRLW